MIQITFLNTDYTIKRVALCDIIKETKTQYTVLDGNCERVVMKKTGNVRYFKSQYTKTKMPVC